MLHVNHPQHVNLVVSHVHHIHHIHISTVINEVIGLLAKTSTRKKKHICCCGGGGWDGQRWIDEGSTHLGSLAIRNILDRGRVRMLKDYSFSMKNSHSLICLASLLFSQNMNIWCILDINSFPVNQRKYASVKKVETSQASDELGKASKKKLVFFRNIS